MTTRVGVQPCWRPTVRVKSECLKKLGSSAAWVRVLDSSTTPLENMGVATEVSFVVVIHALVSCTYLISKYFRFSGRHIGFLKCAKNGPKAPPCSQIIFRKSREGASLNSEWFWNGSKKSGLGDNLPPPFKVWGLMHKHLHCMTVYWFLRCRTESKKTEPFLSSGGYSGGTPCFASTEVG